MSYHLQWPGFVHISFVLIDPITKIVFTKESPLPIALKHLDNFENKYVKLSDILAMFQTKFDQSAISILHDLIKHLSAKPTLDICIKYGTDKTTYLPVSTLLVFALVWPLCKNFKKLRNSMINFIEHFSEEVCNSCGLRGKGCSCGPSVDSHETMDILGYSIMMVDRGCQTSKVNEPSDKTNVKEKRKKLLKPTICENHVDVKVDKTIIQNGFKKPLTNNKIFSKSINKDDNNKNHKGVKLEDFKSPRGSNKGKRNNSRDRNVKKINKTTNKDTLKLSNNETNLIEQIISDEKNIKLSNSYSDEKVTISSDKEIKMLSDGDSDQDINNKLESTDKKNKSIYNKDNISENEKSNRLKKLKKGNKEDKVNDKNTMCRSLENEESSKRNKIWKMIGNEDGATKDKVYSLFLHLPTNEKILKFVFNNN